MSLNRPVTALAAAVAALAALTGVATVTTSGAEPGAGSPADAERRPVQRSTLVCPQPAPSDLAETTFTAFSPGVPGSGAAESGEEDGEGRAGLLPAVSTLDNGGSEKRSEDAKPLLALTQPGRPATHTADSIDIPALSGTATGALAPGWTVQQTTLVAVGGGRGLLGLQCSVPDTRFWFPGVSTAEERHDYIHLTNPDEASATVDLKLYGPEGAIESESGSGINVPAHSTVPVLLSALTPEPVESATLHVAVRSGRVGAQLQAVDEKLGSDWITPAAESPGQVVIPGLPGDATEVRLSAFTPGDSDVTFRVGLAGPSGSFTPAGQETLHVKSGMTTSVDLRELTRGEPASLVLTPEEGDGKAPVVAAARVVRGGADGSGEQDGGGNGGDGEGAGGEREVAFIPSTGPVEWRATAAGNERKGSTLYLTAPRDGAKVKVTASAGSEGGTPAERTVTLKPGSTTAVDDLSPQDGEGRFALTVEPLSGGPVYVSRMLEREEDGIPMFTVQALSDDGGTVTVPPAAQDLAVLNR
ncbi:DUF5719 family protein [Streptomyces sp. WMMC897]|uniref:DUF5719 family protein n=1 Tax=Streptomyces sp. WMMC897 TaxID=3014782 RepID=UPI0022B6CFE0|nr:DUF5719 family protein [Streptomyces sp. WMMC897]MCZ7414595.1 DUF5719 family protein [Streptomyces sp. WMMC897]